ncbi:hypothetical protein Acr_18g0004460 [Actinidia rufa]|uniref:Uncharacterized protein n=1 Tax=Actinidia rufa TaxID=165716 RepID=A0A7J0G667_9ERIC|nr:hypothetical protein Acr_18g0004460 [Actinidia rufa]
MEATCEEQYLETPIDAIDAAEEMNTWGIRPEVKVTQIDGNKLWIKIVFEKKKGGFTKLMEAMSVLGYEFTDTSVTTSKGAILITACLVHDETSAHGLWTKLKEMYRENTSQNKALLRRLVLKLQREDYSGGTNKRVLESHRKRRDKKNCPRNKAQDQSSEAATTAMMAVDESDVLLAVSHAKDLYGWLTTRLLTKDSPVPHDRWEIHEGNAAREGRLKGYTNWRGVSRQEELLSDIGPVVLARRMDEESNRCTEARKASAGISE